MYRKILVPLDGSKLAECILPHIEAIAKGCGTEEVVLVSVTERIVAAQYLSEYRQQVVRTLPPAEPITTIPVTVGKKQEQAQRYLARIARRLGTQGIITRLEVLLGNPAHEITNYAEQNDCSLIAMASHGRSGISRWAYGSVADKILRASRVPVLIVKPPGCVPGV